MALRFLKSKISFIVLLKLREMLLSYHHTTRSLTSSLSAVSLLSVIRPTTFVAIKLIIDVGYMDEQGVKEGTMHTPLRSPCVEGHCGSCVVA
jgi:hypothetical protein